MNQSLVSAGELIAVIGAAPKDLGYARRGTAQDTDTSLHHV